MRPLIILELKQLLQFRCSQFLKLLYAFYWTAVPTLAIYLRLLSELNENIVTHTYIMSG